MSELAPLIKKLQESKQTHVVLLLSEEGVRYLPAAEEVCDCIAEILGDGSKVFPRAEVIEKLQRVETGGSSKGL